MPLEAPPVEYLDFELRIWGEGQRYFAQVTDSPKGSSEKVALDALFQSPEKAELLLLRLENALLRSGAPIRGALSVEEKALRDFGQTVFDTLFRKAESIAHLYAACRADAEKLPGEAGGLRLKLWIDAPNLAQFPWEYLYNSGQREWLGLLHRSPIIRRLDKVGPATALTLDGPLNILGMIANPGGPRWNRIDAERERRSIDRAIEPHEKAGTVSFHWVPGETDGHLLDMIDGGNWHVFHFIGHGGMPSSAEADADEPRGEAGSPPPGEGPGEPVDEPSEGFIVLSDGQGGDKEVRASDLMTMLQGRRSTSLRLVVLNCCDSARGTPEDVFASPAAALVRAGIPAVVAMQFPISEDAAVQFSGVFYQRLAEGWPVEAALTAARRNMWSKSPIEWGIPVLYSRSKTGQLFAITDRRRPAATSPAPRATSERTTDARARLRELYGAHQSSLSTGRRPVETSGIAR